MLRMRYIKHATAFLFKHSDMHDRREVIRSRLSFHITYFSEDQVLLQVSDKKIINHIYSENELMLQEPT